MSRLWMRSFWAVAAVSIGMYVASAAQAQAPGGFFGGGGGGALFMLRDEAVQKELELVPDQVEKLTKLGEKMREDMQAMFTGGRNQSQEEREAQFKKMREAMEGLQKQVDEVLLPHQQKRLQQLARQQRMRGFGSSVNTDVLGSELKLSDTDKEKLAEKAKEVEKDLREKMAKIRREAEEKLLSALSPEQRAQWKDLVGDPFEFPAPQFGRGGPGGRGRGTGGGNPQGGGEQPRRSN